MRRREGQGGRYVVRSFGDKVEISVGIINKETSTTVIMKSRISDC